MSIDVVTYLRNLASPDPYDERPTPHAKELYQAADEIETLRKQLRTEKDSHLSTGHTMGAKAQSLFLELAAMTQERDGFEQERDYFEQHNFEHWEEAAASQAREQQLREWVCHSGGLLTEWAREWNPAKHPPLTKFIEQHLNEIVPQDDTALRQFVRAEQAKLLREMAEDVDHGPDNARVRRKANELEGKNENWLDI